MNDGYTVDDTVRAINALADKLAALGDNTCTGRPWTEDELYAIRGVGPWLQSPDGLAALRQSADKP